MLKLPSSKDVIRVMLVFAIPEIVAMQPYLDSAKAKDLPSIWVAIGVAALGTLVAQLDALKTQLAVKNNLPVPKNLTPP